MRILYLPCHSIHEYEEVLMFHELGHYVFSPGAYITPRTPHDPVRWPIEYDPDPEDLQAWHELSQTMPGQDPKDALTKEFVDRFDVVIVMSFAKWIIQNWDACVDRTVVWRCNGQSLKHTEESLKPYRDQGLKIVRYSPRERTIPGYIGEDALIRFWKPHHTHKDWTGTKKQIMCCNQAIHKRGVHCNYDFFQQVTKIFPRVVYGPQTEELSYGMGKVPFMDLVQAYRDNRAYFYAGTHPASYTMNFIEAWMTGAPVVAVGPGHGNFFDGHDLYEIPDLIQHGVNGFYSDDKVEMQGIFQKLMADHQYAREIGQAGRESALKHFHPDVVYKQWAEFLETIPVHTTEEVTS